MAAAAFALWFTRFIDMAYSYTDLPPMALQHDLLAVEDLRESDNKLDEWYNINQTQFIESGSSLVRFGSVSPAFEQKFKANFNLDTAQNTDSIVFKYFNLDECSISDLMLELEIQNAMNHVFNKHVPRIYHWFKEKNKIIFVMESGGKELKFVNQYVTERGQVITSQIAVDDSQNVAKNRVCSLFMQMVPVLKYMNQKGIHHRDLKIDNILYNDGIWNMIDFGSAQFMHNIGMDSFESYTVPDIMTALTFHFEHTQNEELKQKIFEMMQKDPITNDLPALIVSALKVYVLTARCDDRLFDRVYNVFEPMAFLNERDGSLYSEHSCVHSISMNQKLLLSLVKDEPLRKLFDKWLPNWSKEYSVISDFAKYKDLRLFEQDLIRACL